MFNGRILGTLFRGVFPDRGALGKVDIERWGVEIARLGVDIEGNGSDDLMGVGFGQARAWAFRL